MGCASLWPAACLPVPHASMDRACALGMCPAMCWAGRMSCVAAADACCPVPHPRAFAGAQTHSPWGAALVKGMMCNWLVCLAVWQATAAQDIIGKIVGIYCAQPPAPFPTLPRALLPCRACRDGTATSCGSPVRGPACMAHPARDAWSAPVRTPAKRLGSSGEAGTAVCADCGTVRAPRKLLCERVKRVLATARP